MPPRWTVDRLDDAKFKWLIIQIVNNNLTDRELAAAFAEKFPGEPPLSKSAISRWRQDAGNELADRYQFIRWIADELKEKLGQPGVDSYELAVKNIDDYLLASAREVFTADPVRVLGLRMEDKKIGLKKEQIELYR